MSTLTPEIRRMLAEAQRNWMAFLEQMQSTPLTYQQQQELWAMRNKQDPDSPVYEFLENAAIYCRRAEER